MLDEEYEVLTHWHPRVCHAGQRIYTYSFMIISSISVCLHISLMFFVGTIQHNNSERASTMLLGPYNNIAFVSVSIAFLPLLEKVVNREEFIFFEIIFTQLIHTIFCKVFQTLIIYLLANVHGS